jgi:hypothetical protein
MQRLEISGALGVKGLMLICCIKDAEKQMNVVV